MGHFHLPYVRVGPHECTIGLQDLPLDVIKKIINNDIPERD